MSVPMEALQAVARAAGLDPARVLSFQADAQGRVTFEVTSVDPISDGPYLRGGEVVTFQWIAPITWTTP